jgi:transposase
MVRKFLERECKTHGRPVDFEIWTCDEMRVGLHTDLGRRVTAKGVKPIGKQRHDFANFYVFGAVETATGQTVLQQQSQTKSAQFEELLEAISAQNPDKIKIVVADNASFHKKKDLQIPSNIRLCFLLPYMPEHNSIERFWQEARRALKNKVFKNLAQLKEALWNHFDSLSPNEIVSIVNFPLYKIARNLLNEMAGFN